MNSWRPARRNIVLHRSLLTIGTETSCNTDGSVPPSLKRPHPVTAVSTEVEKDKRTMMKIQKNLIGKYPINEINVAIYRLHCVQWANHRWPVSILVQCVVQIQAVIPILPAPNRIRTWRNCILDVRLFSQRHVQRTAAPLVRAKNRIRQLECESVRSTDWNEK